MRRVVLATALAVAVMAFVGEAQEYVVIANSANPLNEISARRLADIFLGKASYWPNSKLAARPVDLPPVSPHRIAFSKAVLRRSVGEIESYWQGRIFSGRGTPPPARLFESHIVVYVQENEGGVGYVSPKLDLSTTKGVKVLKVVE